MSSPSMQTGLMLKMNRGNGGINHAEPRTAIIVIKYAANVCVWESSIILTLSTNAILLQVACSFFEQTPPHIIIVLAGANSLNNCNPNTY